MRSLTTAVLRLAVAILAGLLVQTSTVSARSWSYHYHPQLEQATMAPTPATVASIVGDQSTEAKLLKRAIVSDLAIYAQNQTSQNSDAYRDQVVTRLSRFDTLNSPEALDVLASLSAYYLGAPAEKLYHCLVVRKGTPLKEPLKYYLKDGSTECLKELGQDFSKPSGSLDGYPLCPTSQQEAERLKELILEIDAGRPCTDNDLVLMTRALAK